MVSLFYTAYISVDLAHYELFRAKVGKGGISLNHTLQTNPQHREEETQNTNNHQEDNYSIATTLSSLAR